MKYIFIILFFFSIKSFSQCLSGNCINGYGTKKIDDDEKYIGNFLGGQRNGTGTTFYKDGSKSFKGVWKDDEPFSGLDYLEDGSLIQIWVKGIRLDKKMVNSSVLNKFESEFSNPNNKYITNILIYLVDTGFDEKSISERCKVSSVTLSLDEILQNLIQWSEYEDFIKKNPTYSIKLENIAYSSLENYALQKRWCSYCCEIYLKLFKNNTEKRGDVTEWRRIAYNFELAEQNAKTISENQKAISEANERAKQNEPKICTVCGGRGVCLECNGKGYKACDYHDTNGDGHCTTCNNRGILNCRKCDNKGTCYRCNGKGKIF
jgi:hypothetical protein